MKKVNNKALRIVFIVFAVLFVLAILKDQVIKTTVAAAASSVLGTKVSIDGFSLGIVKQSVRIKGFKIYNPSGFPSGLLLNMEEVSVNYDLPALLGGKLHIPMAVIDLQEMVVVKNKEGKLNVDALKVTEKAAEKPSPAQPEKPAKQMPMQIDVITLNIGRVIFKDYSKGEPPVIQAYDVQIKDKTYKNISSAQQFAVLVLVEAMKPTAIKSAQAYAAATILGVGFLPAGVAGAILGKDHAAAEFSINSARLYDIALQVLKKSGEIIKEDQAQKTIKAKVDGSDVNVSIDQKTGGQAAITISARKFMLPKQEIAEGILYQIQEKAK